MPVQTNTSDVKTTSGKDQRQGSSAAAGPPPTGVQLYVRLWSGEGSEEPKVPAPARDMIADLLSISGCVMREEAPGLYSANFQDAVQAVRAARHLQRMIRGFCSGIEPGCLNGCVALANAEEPEPALDLPLLHQTQVLQPAQPGQILLVGSLCESARLIPGLQFHPLSGGVVAPDRSGRPRQVLHLLPPSSGQNRAQNGGQPGGQTGSQTGSQPGVQTGAHDATDKPIQYRITATGSRKRITTAEIVAQNAARTPTAESPLVGQGKPGQRKPAAAVSAGIGRGGPRKIPTLWLAIGGVAAAAIVAGIVVLGSSHKAAAPPAALPAPVPKIVQPTAATAPPAVEPTKPIPEPPATVVVPVPRPVPPVASTPAPPPTAADGTAPAKALTPKEQRAKERADAKEKKRVAAEEGNSDPKPSSGGGGSLFSTSDIPSLLSKADRAAGDGDYDRAISTYKSILRLQPSNAAAIEGLRRAQRNRGNQ